MAITQSDRDVGIMAHLTPITKERFRKEAERRDVSMSLLVSEIIEKFLETSKDEPVEQKRSNKRRDSQKMDPLKDIPLPLDGPTGDPNGNDQGS